MVKRKNNKLTTSLSILMASSILYSGISGASSVVNSNTQNFRQEFLVDNIYLTENDSFNINYINNAVIGRPAGFTGFYEYTLDYSVYKDFNKQTLKPGKYPFKVTWGHHTQNIYIIVSKAQLKEEEQQIEKTETVYNNDDKWIPVFDIIKIKQREVLGYKDLKKYIKNPGDYNRYELDFGEINTVTVGNSVVKVKVKDKKENIVDEYNVQLSVSPIEYEVKTFYLNKGDSIPDSKTIIQTAVLNMNKNVKTEVLNENILKTIDVNKTGEHILKVLVDGVEVEIPISVIEKQGTVDNYKQKPLENTYFATTVFLLSLLGVIFGILKFAKWEK